MTAPTPTILTSTAPAGPTDGTLADFLAWLVNGSADQLLERARNADHPDVQEALATADAALAELRAQYERWDTRHKDALTRAHNRKIRDWAKAQGLRCAVRGRLPAAVVAAYERAQAGESG